MRILLSFLFIFLLALVTDSFANVEAIRSNSTDVEYVAGIPDYNFQKIMVIPEIVVFYRVDNSLQNRAPLDLFKNPKKLERQMEGLKKGIGLVFESKKNNNYFLDRLTIKDYSRIGYSLAK